MIQSSRAAHPKFQTRNKIEIQMRKRTTDESLSLGRV